MVHKITKKNAKQIFKIYPLHRRVHDNLKKRALSKCKERKIS